MWAEVDTDFMGPEAYINLETLFMNMKSELSL